MTSKTKTWLAWSSGKDSAWTLHQCRLSNQFEITSLLTTVTTTFQRVAMHAVREKLLLAQAKSIGLPLYQVGIPFPCNNDNYEYAMRHAMEEARIQGVHTILFGDLYLQNIRDYREKQLKKIAMRAAFPLWKTPTTALAQTMIDQGIKAIVTCLDPKRCPAHLAGHFYNQDFLNQLPDDVDPCGEGGEFHTFVYDGPMFNYPLPITRQETVEREGFLFTDITLT